MHAELKYADIKARGEEAKPLWTKIKEMQVRASSSRLPVLNSEPRTFMLGPHISHNLALPLQCSLRHHPTFCTSLTTSIDVYDDMDVKRRTLEMRESERVRRVCSYEICCADFRRYWPDLVVLVRCGSSGGLGDVAYPGLRCLSTLGGPIFALCLQYTWMAIVLTCWTAFSPLLLTCTNTFHWTTIY